MSTSVGPVVVAQAVSGDVTSTSIVGEATGGVDVDGDGDVDGSDDGRNDDDNNNNGSGNNGGGGGVPGAAGRTEALGVKVMGAVLGGVVVVAAML